jgi:PAS domain S-box-containing protein
VTEKEQARQALQQSEIQFRDVLTHAAESILMTDSTGKIMFANRAAATLFGYDADSMLGVGIDELVPEGMRKQHAAHRAGYLSAPEARPMGRERHPLARRRDGSDFPVEVVLSPVVRPNGMTVVCFVSDVTARREADERIRSYQERLRQMAFDAALAEERERRRIAVDLHDRIGQSLALAQMKLDAARETLAGGARDAVDAAVELVKQSITDARTLTFDLSPPILYDLGLKEALAWLAEDMERRYGLKVELKAEDDAPVPLDDTTSALLFRAVRELLTNVFKHAKVPTAQVSIRRAESSVHIDVADEGVGFDVVDAVSGSATPGFGLFSVREQIGRLGGKLDIESVPRQGTRVSLQIPLAGPSDAPALVSPMEPSP